MQQQDVLVETVKSRIIKDGQVCWDFFPKVNNYGSPAMMWERPNINKVLVLLSSFAEELCTRGEEKLAEQVLHDTLYFVIEESNRYNKGGMGWEAYKKKYGYSPCCCCDWQSWVSCEATMLGFKDLARHAVSIQCPSSPSDYRRKVSGASKPGSGRQAENTAVLESFIEGKFNFFERRF